MRLNKDKIFLPRPREPGDLDVKNSRAYLDERAVARHINSMYDFGLVVMRVEATSFPCRDEENAETTEDGTVRRKEKEREEDDREKTRREVAREAERREDVPGEQRRTSWRIARDDDGGTDDTRHRHIKSTLSKYTIIFIIPGRSGARSEYQLGE